MATNDEIKEQLYDILAEVAKTQNITSNTLNPNTDVHYGDGFVAQFFTGEVQNKDTGDTLNVAIKKAPFWEYDYIGLFTNEDLFYKIAFPALDRFQKEANVLEPLNNIPNYFCGSTTEPKREYIAMENLKPLGYEMFDKTKFLDQDHLELILKTYGKFHALSFVFRKINYETYENITKEIVDIGPQTIHLVSKQINSAVSAAVKALNEDDYKVLGDELRDFGENAASTLEKSFQYNGDNKCLVHGDCWSNNMLFKYSESGNLLDVKLLDFQLCRDDTPIHDLSCFFYSSASKKDFDNIEFYLQIYYKSFYEFAKELGAQHDQLISFEVFIKEWKENALFGVIYAIWIWQMKLTPKEDIDQFIEDVEGLPEEESDLFYEALIEQTYGNTTYKENTASIIIHAFEYGVLDKNKVVKA